MSLRRRVEKWMMELWGAQKVCWGIPSDFAQDILYNIRKELEKSRWNCKIRINRMQLERLDVTPDSLFVSLVPDAYFVNINLEKSGSKVCIIRRPHKFLVFAYGFWLLLLALATLIGAAMSILFFWQGQASNGLWSLFIAPAGGLITFLVSLFVIVLFRVLGFGSFCAFRASCEATERVVQ